MEVTVEKRIALVHVECDELIVPLWKGEELAQVYPELEQAFRAA